MYEKCSPSQRNGLIYGSRLRTIKCVQGMVGSATISADWDVFTPDEIDLVRTICADAQARAREKFDDFRAKEPTNK